MSTELEVFIRRRANEQGLSLAEVARRAGMSRQSLYDCWSRDGYPNLATIVELAEVLGVHPLRLLELQFPDDGAAEDHCHTLRWNLDRAELATTLLEHTPQAVIGLDADGQVALLNPAAAEQLQRPPERVLGQPAERILPGEALGRIRAQCPVMSGAPTQPHATPRGSLRLSTRRGEDGSLLQTRAQLVEAPLYERNVVLLLLDPGDPANGTAAEAPPPAFDREPLTGLPDRESTEALLRWAMQRTESRGSELAVLVIELDGFDRTEAGLGPEIADRVLHTAAQRVGGQLRHADLLGHLQRGQFTAILPDTGSRSGALQVAQRICQSLEHPVETGSCACQLQPRIGIALFPEHSHHAVTLLEQARSAATRTAGDHQPGQIVEPDLGDRVARRVALIRDLRRALERRSLCVHYQPVFDLASGELTALEALLRWPEGDTSQPSIGEVIDAAEQAGLLGELDRWVVEQVLSDLAHWQSQGCCVPRVSVNASGRTLGTGALEPAVLSKRLERLGLPPGTLDIELSERHLLDTGGAGHDGLTHIREHTLGVTIDHFGTGYASLISLRDLPAGRLKVDQTLIRDLPTDPDQQALVASIARLGERFGLELAAEGVETRQEAEHLRQLGFTEAQGYHFGYPAPAAAVSEHLATAP
ncbi:EAL domain-containing protein [Halorhodospira halophila]|uniref:Diguanylate cyclase/phosphodiesterase with PAS/PAC sensor(S) n=1 Tax=Halorhodospira halophila (strain DSM 244 / SL1) TaxID=349124 RepID=A1WUX0_HALHL|nr:EAL domain-containing protein [Halorhodospira halophila]ABM61482.1 diguanylate cyclase/phosphodiesterase with PAS/PAC sensor(s) [Halorhodospira halophila SL1]MBK1728730.1 hypothetical protein [Halorhodospira halophila]